jgi:hypothetical protein
LDELPVETANTQKTPLERFGRGSLQKVKTLLNTLDDRMTQVNIEFLKHLNALIEVPETAVTREKDGSVQRKKIEVILTKGGDLPSRYVTDENPLIEQAFVDMEKCLRQIAKRTLIPDAFFIDDEKGGVESVEALRTRFMAFLRRLDGDGAIAEQCIRDILRVAMKIEGKKTDVLEKLTVTFDYGLPKDWKEDVAVWGEAVAQGLASRETGVRRFQGLEGDPLKEELKKIEGEEKKRMETAMEMEVAKNGDDGPPQE